MESHFFALCLLSLAFLGTACTGGEEADFTPSNTPADIPREASSPDVKATEDATEDALADAPAADTAVEEPDAIKCSPDSWVPCDDVCEGGRMNCQENLTLGECECPDSGSKPDAEPEPFSSECDQYGESGKVVVYVKAPIKADHVISLGGWINFPNWMGDVDTVGGLWCHGLPSKNRLICEPSLDNGDTAEVVDGTILEMWPGLSPYTAEDHEQEQTSWYCEEDDCPVGDFLVCKGKKEVCGARSGVLSGGMNYSTNSSGWKNLTCQVK
jgi:hypothetical protein